MSRHYRKGKNPGPIDAWLDTLGYYRKNVAYDETCLFRAISEQLFSCQIHHERCRKDVIDYGRKHYDEFSHLMPKEILFNHFVQLDVHMVVCGILEIHIISKRYKRNIIVFNGNTKEIIKAVPTIYDDTLMLCLMGEDHYDVVYSKEYIQTAGFCQSIVYTLLYENVFNIPSVSKIVQTMLYEKTTLMVVNSECNEIHMKNNEKAKLENNSEHIYEKKCSANDYEYMLQTNIAPFAFKVAKALDENIYRNIEYDTWTEIRKELRLGQWYYGDNNLILGTCCLLTTSEGILQCYIQEIKKDENKCVVYITNLAEKRIVRYSDLSPEDNAKPWPLPYRFARHTNNQQQAEQPEIKALDVNNNTDKSKRSLRRRRDNKRNQSRSSSDSGPTLTLPIKTDIINNNSVKNFEGSPLQHTQNFEQQHTIQTLEDHQNVDYTEYAMETTWTETVSAAEQAIIPRSPVTSQGVYTYMPKQVMSPAEIPNTDTLYNTQSTQAWIPTSDEPQTLQEHIPQSPQEVLISPNPYPYYYDQLYQSPLMPITTIPPTSPHMPFYPSIFSNATPVTPIIYTTGHETQDVYILSPPTAEAYTGIYSPNYNPPIDMSFISPSFVYPPHPTWYRPPPVDAQGFIFPTPVAPQK